MGWCYNRHVKSYTLAELCRRHRVRRLELFGSAATGRFDPISSDLDFIVELEPMGPVLYGRTFDALQGGLEQLFGRRVDLISAKSIVNPYFARSIAAERVTLYDAAA